MLERSGDLWMLLQISISQRIIWFNIPNCSKIEWNVYLVALLRATRKFSSITSQFALTCNSGLQILLRRTENVGFLETPETSCGVFVGKPVKHYNSRTVNLTVFPNLKLNTRNICRPISFIFYDFYLLRNINAHCKPDIITLKW